MSFCTVINCMDGRVQIPVIQYLQERFAVPYVDSVTEPGPLKALAEDPGGSLSESMLSKVAVSMVRHGSKSVAVVAHADCAGNPVDEAAQREQLTRALDLVAGRFPGVTLLGLWVDEEWDVHEAELRDPVA